MKKILFTLWICLILFFCSCDNSQYLLRESISIENETWIVDNQLPFYFTATDTQKIYKIGFNIRYTNDYPMQNIYVFLHTVFPNGMRAHDTIDIDLFSPEGQPLGKGKKFIELQKYFSRVQFPMTGQYTMSLEQAMRTDTLPGIISMGLCIAEQKVEQKTEKKKRINNGKQEEKSNKEKE
jgi:gliding motility-associated lipoprotein GldH